MLSSLVTLHGYLITENHFKLLLHLCMSTMSRPLGQKTLEMFACRPAYCRNEIKGMGINGSFPLICSKQTTWAKGGQPSVCPNHYYSSQRILKPITEQAMAFNAEFSNACLTHLRQLWKSSFFLTAIRSGSSSFESQVTKKRKKKRCSWQEMAPCRLQQARASQLPRDPAVLFAAGFLRLIFSLSERLFSASMQTGVCRPGQLSMSPREAGGKPRHLRESRRLEKEFVSFP